MYKLIIPLILILFFYVIARLIYLTLLGLTLVINKLSTKQVFNVENKRDFKRKLFIGSLILSCIITYFSFFISPSTNYNTAYIEKEKEHFIITVKGRRQYMAHELVSLFIRKTYEDSNKYIIPRINGVTKGYELPKVTGQYNSVGTISIEKNQVDINLSFDNTDDKKLDPDDWNGHYKLVWREK